LTTEKVHVIYAIISKKIPTFDPSMQLLSCLLVEDAITTHVDVSFFKMTILTPAMTGGLESVSS
jgi:hypothetical protein